MTFWFLKTKYSENLDNDDPLLCFAKGKTNFLGIAQIIYDISILLDLYKFNSLPNINILVSTELKSFTGNKIIAAHMMISLFDRVENIVVKGENSGYQHFCVFPQCFPKTSFPVWLEVGIVW